MTTTVMVDDTVSDRVTRYSYPDEHRDFVKRNWEQPDKLLAGLQHLALFKDRTRWCDLDPLHFRVLLVHNLEIYSNLTETERDDRENSTVVSLNFLLMALIHCIEQRSMLEVHFLTVTRLTPYDVSYEVSARFYADMGFLARPRKPRLSVVVDNTRTAS